MWILNRSDTNQAVQPLEMARGWKFCIEEVEVLYYPSSENKDADQLRGYREADLRLFAYADCWFSHDAAHFFFSSRDFDTEREADIVQVYVGSIIEINAVPVATLSGQLNTNRREYEYLSPNNMITIKFMSDSYVTGSGFSVEFGSGEFTVKFLNFLMPEHFAVIYLKFKQRGQT